MSPNRIAAQRFQAIRDLESARDALEHPGVVKVAAMLRTPKWMFDASPETQGELIDAIDAIPRFIRRCLFGLPARLDPLYPVACAMNEVSCHSDTINYRSSSLEACAWLYAVSRQRINQVELRAFRTLKSDKRIKALREHLEYDAKPGMSANKFSV